MACRAERSLSLASLESGLKAANYKISTKEIRDLMIFKRAFKARKVPGAIFARYVEPYFTTVHGFFKGWFHSV